MITARAGSGMATELGSMRVSEQIDALTTFAVNPVQYLVTPRIVASIVMLPIMTMVFNFVGLVGLYVIAVVVEHVDFGQLTALYRFWTDPIDYVKGLIKAGIFGFCLSLAACYQGFFVRGGAKEVGRATTRAVVVGSVSILVLDYFLIKILSCNLAICVVSPEDNSRRPANDDGRIDARWQIRVRGLQKSFGLQHVLKGVDLDIERGKINIIIGGSGQGKSVLMKHLMGLLQPDAGTILVDGENVVGLSEVELSRVRRKFGMVFQYAALFDSMSVMENVAFPLRERYRLTDEEMRDRVMALLTRLDLAGVAGIEDKFPPELSGGMRKRVGLARALIDRPEILLYDEPTTGLDPSPPRTSTT